MRRLAVPLTVLLALVGAGPAHAGYGLAPQPTTSTGNTPAALASADFNEDGLPDLVSANCGVAACGSGASSLTVLLNNGSGGFTTSTLTDTNSPAYAYAGDLNNDGDADIAAADVAGQVTLFAGDGTGAFTVQPSSSLAGTPRGLEFADADGDGDRDLLAPVTGANALQFKTNSGGFNFAASVTTIGAVGAQAIIARDFDGDGDNDAAVALGSSGKLALFANTGGAFSTPNLIGLGGFPVSLTAGDFNGDGDLDVAAATTNNSVAVLLGGPQLTFGEVATYPAGVGLGNTIAVTSADMNGDGILDLVTRTGGGFVRVLDGRGDGTFATSGLGLTGASGSFASSTVTARDFTGDGVPDIAVPNAGANTVSLLKSAGVLDAQSPADFDDTAVGARSTTRAITIKNSGLGAMPLNAATLGGTSPGDFQIVRNCGGIVAAGQTCDLLVRFAPTTTGTRSATVSLVNSDFPATIQAVNVSGVGTTPPAPVVGPTGPQGPAGSNGTNGTGTQGAPGTNGTNGLNGAVGPTGAAGARGPAGRDATVTCKPVGTKKVKVTCTVKLASVRTTSLRLVRGKTLYATGKVTRSGAASLKRKRPLTPGRYVLEVRSRGKTTRQAVRI